MSLTTYKATFQDAPKGSKRYFNSSVGNSKVNAASLNISCDAFLYFTQKRNRVSQTLAKSRTAAEKSKRAISHGEPRVQEWDNYLTNLIKTVQKRHNSDPEIRIACHQAACQIKKQF